MSLFALAHTNFRVGERVRLCLAQIAAKTPPILILDEITNNIDIETRNHVTQVLKFYPGAMIAISHDTHFLKSIAIQSYYSLENGKIGLRSEMEF